MSRRRKRPKPGAASAFARFDRRAAGLLRTLSPDRQLACERGCTHCCAQRVSVTPLEALAVAQQLRSSCDGAELAAVRERLRETAARVRGTTTQQHRGTICALLDDGSCRVYDHRPLLCRGANSFDTDACATLGAPIPSYGALAELAQSTQNRLDEECLGISGRAEILELAGAILAALEPDAEARWREGEPVFTRAAHSWIEDGVLHHWQQD